ncbi:MAG: hypothetical protein AMXMBFR13_28000 [Phycisphaerae bacterium]
MGNRSRKATPEGKPEHCLTEAEWAIMKVVWSDEPCAAGTIQEALEKSKGWSYATVKTMMDRMVKKSLLSVKRIRNLQLYESRISQTEARRSELRRMLKRAFDDALTPMMQFLLQDETLSSEALEELRSLIEEDARNRGKAGQRTLPPHEDGPT